MILLIIAGIILALILMRIGKKPQNKEADQNIQLPDDSRITDEEIITIILPTINNDRK